MAMISDSKSECAGSIPAASAKWTVDPVVKMEDCRSSHTGSIPVQSA